MAERTCATSPSPKKLLARERPVDELVDDNENARRQVLAQRAARRERDDIGHAQPLEDVDVGAVFSSDGGMRWPRPWRGRNTHLWPRKSPDQQLVGWPAPGEATATHSAPSSPSISYTPLPPMMPITGGVPG